MKRESRAPLIIAVVVLLLFVLYLGSYLALVIPTGRTVITHEPGAGRLESKATNRGAGARE